MARLWLPHLVGLCVLVPPAFRAEAQSFVYEVPAATGYYSSATGAGDLSAQVRFTDLEPQFQTNIPCFSVVVVHDPDLLAVAAVNTIGPVAALNGGAGPDYLSLDIFPDRFALGAVTSFMGIELLVLPVPANVLAVQYSVGGPALLGNAVGTSTTLHFSTGAFPPPAPPTTNVLCYGDGGHTPFLDDGAIDLLPATPFRRGDVNQDGALDIADPIYTIQHLFRQAALDCPRAADTNDDHQLDLADAVFGLATLFGQGPPPPAPFPGCGFDPASPLACPIPPACP